MAITVEFRFVDAEGNDVTGCEEVAGYHWADFFGAAFERVDRAATVAEADGLLRAAYKGPDSDGIGVRWDLERRTD